MNAPKKKSTVKVEADKPATKTKKDPVTATETKKRRSPRAPRPEKKESERVAETETEEKPAQAVLAPVATTVTVSEPEQQVLTKQMPMDNFRPLLQAEEHHDPTINTEPIVSTWGKAKAWVIKHRVTIIVIAGILILAWIVSGIMINSERRKVANEKQQTERAKSYLKRIIDSNHAQILTLEYLIYEQRKASDQTHESLMEFRAKRKSVVDYYLNENFHLHEKIDSTKNPDDVRALFDSLFAIPK